ncbi:LOW QUALITY PROTEIN: uncharacterized protein C1orf94 homolog [Ciconia maguari]
MLPGRKRFSAPIVTSEGPFPLGPFPRHIWIHNNTPQDSLDEACHEIWKRVQRLSEELQPPSLVSPLQHALCSDLSGTLQRDGIDSQSDVKDEIILVKEEYLSITQNTNETEMQGLGGVKKSSSILSQTSFNSSHIPLSYSNYLLDEPEGLEGIYRAVIGNREREMKLRALCDTQLSAKSVITSLLCSAKSHKNSKGLEDGSVTGAHSMEGSKLEVPFLLKYTDTAKGAGNPVTAEETKVEKEFIEDSVLSSAKSSTSVSSTATAESQAMGQKQQPPPFAKICSKTDADAVTKNPVTTATSDKKNVKYNASTSGFSTTSMTTAFNQPVWQSLSFPPLPIFPNHSNFPQFQGPYHQRARIPYQQALHPSFGCYSRQVAPYSPQQIFQPPYTPMLNYITLVQPGYPYQQRTPPTLSSNIQDLSPMAGDGIQYPFSPSYGRFKALTFDNEPLPLQNSFCFLWSLHHYCQASTAQFPLDNDYGSLSTIFQPQFAGSEVEEQLDGILQPA